MDNASYRHDVVVVYSSADRVGASSSTGGSSITATPRGRCRESLCGNFFQSLAHVNLRVARLVGNDAIAQTAAP